MPSKTADVASGAKPAQAPSPTPGGSKKGVEPTQEAEPASNQEEQAFRREQLAVKPVEGEPTWPDPSDEKEVDQRGFVKFPGGYQYERRDAQGKVTGTGAVVEGMVIMNREIIELLACAEGSGKEHESALRLHCDVSSLDLAFAFCGFQRGPNPERLNDPTVPQGARLIVLVQWTDEQGKAVTHRAEDVVISIKRESAMPRVGWSYVGTMRTVEDLASLGGKKPNRVLSASESRLVITTWRFVGYSLLENPLEEADDDTMFAANYEVLPEPGTKVRVIFRAPTEVEWREIAALEAELAK